MLSELYINNVAIISEEILKFDNNFTILTGETGAGKSIIIDSIDLILGARSSKEIIRHGESKAKVIAQFTSLPPHSISKLNEFGLDIDGDECTIVREVSENGSSARINGKPVSISMLKDISPYLINIHGQHSNQALLNEENHIQYLDAFSDNKDLLEQYSILYSKASEIKTKIISLTRDEKEKARRIEMLKFQINEIKTANLKKDEENELSKLKIKAENAEAFAKINRIVTRSLYQSEKGASAKDLVAKSIDALERIKDIIPKSEEYITYLNEFMFKCEEITDAVNKECSSDIENPNELIDRIENRLNQISILQKKYGNSIEEILDYKKQAENELNEIETSSEKIKDLNIELKSILSEMQKLAKEISSKRQDAAAFLEKRMTSELKFLEMNNVQFKVNIEKSSNLKSDGFDNVSFLISANAGEPLAPLSKIASGGELSRTMLALKCALADKELTPTLIFDEIDTGISGKTSHKIGIKLKMCSSSCQIICVTHSPQIASIADTHIYVSKYEKDGRTFTNVKNLSFNERINEIARIIGGEKITDKTIKAAEDMLNNSQNIE